MSLLKTTDLGISFGGLRAVDNVNIEIKEGELIGHTCRGGYDL